MICFAVRMGCTMPRQQARRQVAQYTDPYGQYSYVNRVYIQIHEGIMHKRHANTGVRVRPLFKW